MNHKALKAAYLDSNYYVEGIDQPILIGENNDEIIELLIEKRAKSWAFITAYNPMSEQYTDDQNIALNKVLEAELSAYNYLKGVGTSRSGDWPGEDSFFIIGITFSDAERLMTKYRQRAIVFGSFDGVAELVVNEYEK